MEKKFTKLDAQPNFAQLEEKILAFWQKEDIFTKTLTKNIGKEKFVIYDGPPTANAKPPLHTMVPMSFKDLVGRYKTMQGYLVPRQAGWDTHGLPVEVQVEKAMGLTSKKDILNLVPGDEKASIQQFNQACRQSVWEFKQEWDKFVPRVGYFTDYLHPYITYENDYIEKVWSVFKRIWDKGMVYKGYKVLPYCPRCGTALSAAEVAQEYHDLKDTSVYVTFPLKDNPNRSFLAWTTTPWTLPGNVALAVHEKIQYVVVKQDRGEYILAKDRLEALRGDYVILEEMPGKKLLGMQYLPIFPGSIDANSQTFKVYGADFVNTEEGTGIVHTAVMYGVDDFSLGEKTGLPMQHTVDLEGNFNQKVKEFTGQNVREALPNILTSLAQKGRLYGKQIITHSYPLCWRCKTPLIYYAKDSWFIAMSKQREELIASNNKVNWFPDYIKEGRFGDFIREARDWAISRERFWGTPMPIWVSQSGQMLCIGSLAELKSLAKDPSQIKPDLDLHRPFIDEIVLLKDGEEYFREPLVLDVWFDSGSMPFASHREEKGEFPANYISEAIDQTRGWFYTLQAISTLVKGVSPFQNVTCIGHLVDENGKKMSKSLGNVFNPWETFPVYGVDTIRWWIYTVNSPGEAKALSLKELQTTHRKSVLLLWNVVNYYLTYANLHQISIPTVQERQALYNQEIFQELEVLDRWILSQQVQVVQEVTQNLNDYDIMRAGRRLEKYLNDLSTWYLRRSRRREDANFFKVMYDVLINFITMNAPFMPFVTETIYQALRQDTDPQSVHLLDWVKINAQPDLEVNQKMELVRQAVEIGLSLRVQNKIKVRQPLKVAYIEIKNMSLQQSYLDILADELNVLEVAKGLEKGLPTQSSEMVTVSLDVQLDDQLILKGLGRDFLRQVQQQRKQKGLKPGELVKLIIDPSAQELVEEILQANPEIAEQAFLSQIIWRATDQYEFLLSEQNVFIELV